MIYINFIIIDYIGRVIFASMNRIHILYYRKKASTRICLTVFLLLSRTPMFALGMKGSKEWWIDKYLSVNFPLRSIKVNSYFGQRTDPITGKKKTHGGLDLQANYEDAVAMFDGYVKDVGRSTTSGIYVILKHGRYTVSYCHLSQTYVYKNQQIYSGDLVGVKRSSGRSAGPHLHITSRLKGELIDPIDLLAYVRETKLKAIEALKTYIDKVYTPNDFVEQFAPLAMRQQKKYGIPTSVILSQMALESYWGNSDLAQKGNNYFGIKANNTWLSDGLPYSLHDDDQKDERFCNFSPPEESLEYHSRLLMSDRYARCWRYDVTDYHHWLLAIKASGYATRPDYVKQCEKIIKKYKLYKYDIAVKNKQNNNT